MSDHEPAYLALNRAEYPAEHTCMPYYVPRYCAEEAQFLSMLAEAFSRRKPPPGDDRGRFSAA